MKKAYVLMAAGALAVSIPAIAQAAGDQHQMSDVQHHKTMGAGHHPQTSQKPDCDKDKKADVGLQSGKVNKHEYHDRTDNPED
ncbi:MAG: hypothetical protein R8K50_10415 [Mariprofundus sp.]